MSWDTMEARIKPGEVLRAELERLGAVAKTGLERTLHTYAVELLDGYLKARAEEERLRAALDAGIEHAKRDDALRGVPGTAGSVLAMTDRMTDERLAEVVADHAAACADSGLCCEAIAELRRARAEEAAQRHRAWTLEQHLDKVRADTIEDAAQCAEDFRCEDWPRCYSGECEQLTLAAAAIRDLAGKAHG